MTRPTVLRSIAVVLLVSCRLALAAPPPPKLALTECRIIPIVGEELAKGMVLIENGKITGVGEKLDIPYDAMVLELPGKVVMPGAIDVHTARGMDIPNENLPVTPFLDVYDAIDPSSLTFEDALRDGVTSVHVIPGNNCVIGGLGRVVRPIGLTPDEMTVLASSALKVSVAPKGGLDRIAQMAKLRETFLELDDYMERLAEQKYEEEQKKKDKEVDVPPAEAKKLGKELIRTEDIDDQHRELKMLVDGKRNAFIYCEKAMDVGHAVQIAKENGFLERSTLVLGPECFKAIPELKKAECPIVLDPELVYRREDPFTGKIEETFVPKKFHEAGLSFALQNNPDASLAERYFTYQAARCVRNGVPRKAALEAITLYPAKILGLGDRLGSIEAGKDANLVVFSGDPLDFSSWVEKVIIDGVLCYEREKDVRLQKLMEMPATTSRPAEE